MYTYKILMPFLTYLPTSFTDQTEVDMVECLKLLAFFK